MSLWRRNLMRFVKSVTLGVAAAIFAAGTAYAEVKIRVQSVIPSKADEVHMLNEFAADVAGAHQW